MNNILAQICSDKLLHIQRCADTVPMEKMEQRAVKGPIIRGFADNLRTAIREGRTGLIAEIKKASPSKGLIRANFAPEALAQAYEKGGASCLSVLTDIPYFQGKNDYLTTARMATKLPVLRKDFILDPYQVFESRAIGADCILLIMAAIDDDTAATLSQLSNDLGMDVLVEVHNTKELVRASKISSQLIGINNRNLKTLDVDLKISENLASLMPENRILVAESGINSKSDLDRMAAVGARCVLVGESLMRKSDVTQATRLLLHGDIS